MAEMAEGAGARAEGEAQLVARARAGDRAAFERLVSDHLPRVWPVVWRIVRSREDAEDVVQETFLSAWQSLDGFRGDASFATWLHRIAVSRALNHVDRAAERIRRASSSLDAPPSEDAPTPELPASSPSPLRALESKELMARLTTCLERLPSTFRAVLALREAESLAYEEIASVLDLAVGTVRSRLARARTTLKDCVEGRG